MRKRTTSKPPAKAPEGIPVDTVDLLHKVQLAFIRSHREKDEALFSAAESVLSAVVVVLRSRQATVPVALRPYIERIS